MGPKIQQSPEFHHFEVGAGEREFRGNAAMHAALEAQKDIFVTVGNLLRIIPLAGGGDAIDFVLHGENLRMIGGPNPGAAWPNCGVLGRARGLQGHVLKPVGAIVHAWALLPAV
jgi:hypothetical protein